MAQPYIPLVHTDLAPNASYCRPVYLSKKVTLESPAVADGTQQTNPSQTPEAKL